MKNFITKLKKIVLVFLTILMLSLSLAPSAKAAVTTSWYNQSFQDWFLRVYSGNDSEIFGERYTAAQVQWIFYSLRSFVTLIMYGGNADAAVCAIGHDISNCYDAVKNGFRDILSYEGSPVGSTLAYATSNPLSGISYIKGKINKFKIVPEVNAQAGFGFDYALDPVLRLWKISRDFCYALSVIAIVIFAFMIMFRIKINPQTVITVQNALPKVVIALILLTFSYAIAGLLVDLMYVIMALLVSVLTNPQYGLFGYDFPKMFSLLLGRSMIEIFIGYWFGFAIAADAMVFSANFVVGILMLIITLPLFILLLIYSIKSIFLILKNFGLLVLTIITGPFEIILGTIIPSMGFGSWIRKVMSHLMVYPIIAVIILVAHLFLAQGMPHALSDLLQADKDKPNYAEVLPFDPSYDVIEDNKNWNVPFTTGERFGTELIWLVVSYVLILQIPKVFDIIKSIMEKKPYDYGSAIGESFGPANFATSDLIRSYRSLSSESMTEQIAIAIRNAADKNQKSKLLRWGSAPFRAVAERAERRNPPTP